MGNETNQNYGYVDRPYDAYLNRTTISIGEGSSSKTDTSESAGTSNSNSDVTSLYDPATNGSVESMPVKSEGGIGDVWIKNFIKSDNWKPKTVGFYINGLTGYAEFTNVYISGNIQALTGQVGGWTISDGSLYATTTGTIKTGVNVGIGYNGVIIDKDGLRMFDDVLGQVVNLPSDGSAPTFASGIINSTIFNVNTNAVIQTSTTVGDGSASSAGILMNNTGLYACQANQTLANANVKILVNGSAFFSGTVTAGAGAIGGFNLGTDYIRDAANSFGLASTVTAGTDIRFWAGDTFANRATAPFRIDELGNAVVTSLKRKDFHLFTIFESLDGYYTGCAGTGTLTTGSTGVHSHTGTTSGDYCQIQKYLRDGGGDLFTWDKNRSQQTTLYMDTNWNNVSLAIYSGSYDSTTTTSHIGFNLLNGTIYGTVGNGTSETTLSLRGFGANFMYVLRFDHVVGVGVEFFVNQVSYGTITTNIPTGTGGAAYIFGLWHVTSTNATRDAYISYYDLWQQV